MQLYIYVFDKSKKTIKQTTCECKEKAKTFVLNKNDPGYSVSMGSRINKTELDIVKESYDGLHMITITPNMDYVINRMIAFYEDKNAEVQVKIRFNNSMIEALKNQI